MTRSDVVGLPVVSMDGGEALGRVQDVLCDRQGTRVIGLLLEGGSWRRRRVVPFEEVFAVGRDAVVLRQPVVLPSPAGGRLAALRSRHNRLVGQRLLSARGEELGIVDDLVFDPGTGRIEGFLVSGGVVQDLLTGKKFLPSGRRLVWGRDALILIEARRSKG